MFRLFTSPPTDCTTYTCDNSFANDLKQPTRDALKVSLLRAQLSVERKLRENAEMERKRIQDELEDLTSNLFIEASEQVRKVHVELDNERKGIHGLKRHNQMLEMRVKELDDLVHMQRMELYELKQLVRSMANE